MDILNTILKDTRKRVDAARITAPLGALELLPAFRAPTLSLRDALQSKRVAVIAEMKKASPSAGLLRGEYHVSSMARAYRKAGAAAISVLTEPDHFQGSIDDLAQVRMVVDLPILRKDFIIDPYQLVEARAWGADAVLLIAAALDADQITDLMETASELGMECLVEVHDASELDKLDFSKVKLLGVNNRDLTTFDVDLRQTLRVADLVPTDVTIVSESGFSQGSQLLDFARMGVEGFLVGSVLMKSSDPGRKLEKLLAESEVTRRAPSPLRRVAV